MSRTLNQAFPIVAAALGNHLGVRVCVAGQDAHTDGDRITVPAYDGDDPDYRAVAWGYLAHEAAHVRYTDFEAFREAAAVPLRKALLNILEDVRIERCLAASYPGTRLTIEKTIEKLVASGDFAVPPVDAHPAALVQAFLLFRLRQRDLGQTALAGLADQAAHRLEARLPVGAVTRLHGLLADVPGLSDTRAALRLADRLLTMFEAERDRPPEPPAPGEEGQRANDSSSSASHTNEKDQNEAGSPARDASDGTSASGASVPDGREAGAKTSPARTQEGGDSSALHTLFEATDTDLLPDLFDQARDCLQLQAPARSGLTLPAADEPPLDPRRGQALLGRAVAASGQIRATLQGLVQSSRLRKPVAQRTGNRVDGRRLVRLAQGDPRVFVRQSPQAAPNTAVHLLVDRSPSMSARVHADGVVVGSRSDLAWDACLALALALEGIPGVNPAVTAFPGRLGDADSVYRIVDHGMRVRNRAGAFGIGVDGGTPLAEGLWYAASRLLACREPRKLLLALTDGQPNDREAALDILGRCRVSGIEVVGIGLGLAVDAVFDRALTIQRMPDLKARLFDLSRDLLIAA
jgi:cobalamin biosynthesis protein CobT